MNSTEAAAQPASNSFATAGVTLFGIALHLAGLGPLLSDGLSVRLTYAGSFAAFASYFIVVGFLLNAIEGAVFTEGEKPVRGLQWLGGIVYGAIVAALAAWIYTVPPDAWRNPFLGVWTESPPIGEALRTFVEARGPRVWLHVGYASITYMVAYCVIGSATWPFCRPYYEDPSSPLQLRVPSGPQIIGLQLARGLIATLALLPLFAGLDLPREGIGTWLRLALTLAVTCSIVPMLLTREWPTRLRVIHGVEISIFALVQGFSWWWFLLR